MPPFRQLALALALLGGAHAHAAIDQYVPVAERGVIANQYIVQLDLALLRQLNGALPVGELVNGLLARVPGAELLHVYSRALPGLSLRQLRQCDDPLPELAQALTDPLRPAASTPPVQPPHVRQPLWLFDPPQPLSTGGDGQPRWRGAPLTLLGPDRTFSSHWWQQPRHRDYFLARHPGNQALCWLYHCDAGWFLHGLF